MDKNLLDEKKRGGGDGTPSDHGMAEMPAHSGAGMSPVSHVRLILQRVV